MMTTLFIFPSEWQGLALGKGCRVVAEEGDVFTDIVFVVFDLLQSHTCSTTQVTVVCKFLQANILSVSLSSINYCTQSQCIWPKRLELRSVLESTSSIKFWVAIIFHLVDVQNQSYYWRGWVKESTFDWDIFECFNIKLICLQWLISIINFGQIQHFLPSFFDIGLSREHNLLILHVAHCQLQLGQSFSYQASTDLVQGGELFVVVFHKPGST